MFTGSKICLNQKNILKILWTCIQNQTNIKNLLDFLNKPMAMNLSTILIADLDVHHMKELGSTI